MFLTDFDESGVQVGHGHDFLLVLKPMANLKVINRLRARAINFGQDCSLVSLDFNFDSFSELFKKKRTELYFFF